MLYRVRQLLAGWRPWLSPDEIAEVRGLLSARYLALFVGMQGRDQTHSLRVRRRIQRTAAERGVEPSRALVEAALLHDIGKGSLATWQRVLFVLLNALSVRFARLFERERGPGWQHALWRLRHHARLGAERLTAIGADARLVELVRRHTERPGDDAELAWLIGADGAS